MADSWLIDGNCKNCRRKSYCSKVCTKAKERRRSHLYNAVMRETGMGQVLGEIARFNR